MSDEIVNLAPPLTPEQLQTNNEFQKQQRARLSLPQSASKLEHARRVISSNLRVLAILQDQFGKTSKEQLKLDISEKAQSIKRDVCLWMMTIGNFEEAAEICPDENQAEIYRKYAEAEIADDSHWCAHPRWILAADGKFQPNYYREFDYFSQKRSRQTTMTRCTECDMRNAVDLPPDLAEIDRKRQQLVAEHLTNADTRQI